MQSECSHSRYVFQWSLITSTISIFSLTKSIRPHIESRNCVWPLICSRSYGCQPASSSEEILDLADKENSKPIQIVEKILQKNLITHMEFFFLPRTFRIGGKGGKGGRHQSVLGFILAGINHVSFHIYWRIT
jgi:hypothetical protein